MIKTAIMVDGGFYRKVMRKCDGPLSAKDEADRLIKYCYDHLKMKNNDVNCYLYRIFYYDCPPSNKKVYNPITKTTDDLSKSPVYRWMEDFISEMTKRRKVALRLGYLSDVSLEYTLKPQYVKAICEGKLNPCDISKNHLDLTIKQKGVDMKIGIDIASLAYKKQVDRIVLIAGDSDFVPAAKLARREGIDFVLDPLWQNIRPDLHEHIDGMITKLDKNKIKQYSKK